MWDDRRKVGVLNGFGSARLEDDEDISERNSRGATAFLALGLVGGDFMEDDPRRFYRHGAESFAWSLVYLCLSTVEDKNGENRTESPNPRKYWFRLGEPSFMARIQVAPDRHSENMVYPNTEELAWRLADRWVTLYSGPRRRFVRIVSGGVTRLIGDCEPFI